MKRFVKTGGIFAIILILGSEIVFLLNIKSAVFDTKNFKYSKKMTIDAYADDFLGVVYPCEIKSFEETKDGFIAIHTNPKSFIVAPIKLELTYISKYKMRGVHFKRFGFDCYFYGFEVLVVQNNSKCNAGDVIGSIVDDILYVRVYKNENRVSLKTLTMLLGG